MIVIGRRAEGYLCERYSGFTSFRVELPVEGILVIVLVAPYVKAVGPEDHGELPEIWPVIDRDDSVRSHVYRPVIERQDTQRQLVGRLIDRAFEGSVGSLLLGALDARPTSKKELDQLRQLIDERAKGRK